MQSKVITCYSRTDIQKRAMVALVTTAQEKNASNCKDASGGMQKDHTEQGLLITADMPHHMRQKSYGLESLLKDKQLS